LNFKIPHLPFWVWTLGGALTILAFNIAITLRAEYGFHLEKIEENVKEWRSLPIQYAGASACIDCHQDIYTVWAKSNHIIVSCENCHGPARAHLENRARLTGNTSRELCELCHAKLVSRPSDFPQVDVKKHGGQSECITCHNQHISRP